MMMKKTILILIPHYLPGYKIGGPLTSIINMINNLSDDFDFKVLTSDRDMGDNSPYSEVIVNRWLKMGNHQVCYIPKNLFTIFSLIRYVNKTPKDILYINSFFGPTYSIAIIFFAWIGAIKAEKIIVAPRGEFFDEALNFKKYKKSLYLRLSQRLKLYKSVIWHASTDTEKEKIVKNMKVESSMVRVAINISSVDEGIPDLEKKCDANCVHEDNDALKIIFLSRISKDKNINYAIDILSEITEGVMFDIYGPMEDDFIWQACLEKINKLPDNIVVRYKGVVNKPDVKNILAKYDLMFLPTLAENYGHVIVESLCVGTPVLISDNTPWQNLEAEGLGWDFSLECPSHFIESITKMTAMPFLERQKNRKNIKEKIIRKLRDPSIIEANKKLFA